MKAGDLIHAKTMKLCEQHPGMEYADAQAHVFMHDPKLKEAYAMDLEVPIPADLVSSFEIMNPITPAFIDEVIARGRQAVLDGTVHRLRGALGRLVQQAWSQASGEGREVGAVLREIIDRGSNLAALAAGELATNVTPPVRENAERLAAGTLVAERAQKLVETHYTKPTYQEAISMALKDDPELARDYTGVQP